MSNIAYVLNDWLKAIYDTEDEIYRSFMADIDGVPEDTITVPMDYNIGAIASALEYLRQSTKLFVRQMFFNEAEGEWLDLILVDYFGLMRKDGEDDTEWATRVRDVIIGPKMSNAAIIYNTRQYSDSEPEIVVGDLDAAFADVTFSDAYDDAFVDSDSGEYVMPAIMRSHAAGTYYFRLLLEGTSDDDLIDVVNTVNSLIAAGIEYEVVIS